MEKNFQKVISFVLYLILFIFPFFLLPFTQEYFVTNKLYLLTFGGLLLLLLSVVHLLISKKISWQKHPFDNLVLLFLSVISISIIFTSPNKIQAVLNPSFGLLMMVSLAILYFYASRQNTQIAQTGSTDTTESAKSVFFKVLSVSSVLLSLVTIIFYFQPFKNVNLPQAFSFLKNPGFTPLGSQLDLAVFLGFFVVYGVVMSFPRRRESSDSGSRVILNFSFLTLNLLALFFTLYSLLKPIPTDSNQLPISTVLPPFRLSWYAAVETLKRPLTALFGVGVDNFSSMFTAVKDMAYNQSSLWQISSFNVSRSAVLHILTETGILGLAAFGLLIFSVMKSAFVKTTADKQSNNETIKPFIFSFIYLLICLFIFPSSLVIWFLFFVTLGVINHAPTEQWNNGTMKQSMDLGDLFPLYIGIVVISLGVIGGAGYFAGRSYASEYYFKKSLDGYVKNSVKELYDNQREAIILNPFIEKYHLSFSQTNLLIADNLSKKDSGKISEQDRQTVTQAIQASIAEAKSAVSLNPLKAVNWENLANIYRNIINVAQGSDVWTISAYQRAILADPQNPLYRVGLGGVYYSLKKYDDSLKFFEQAISLKPDWPNANYNYAWANFQKTNYPQAVNAMQNTLSLLDIKLNKADYEKVQKELDEFKKMLPKEEKEATQEGEIKPGTLTLPTPPETKVEPKIELPREASPEAK